MFIYQAPPYLSVEKMMGQPINIVAGKGGNLSSIFFSVGDIYANDLTFY